MTLLRRIAAGEFEDQSYLPSIPRLMEEYGVMKDTASRAIGLLSKMGVIQTIQRKGTVVLSTNETTHNAGAVDFQDSVVRQRLSSCLDALEIMALGVSSCVVDVSGASEQWACSMEYQLSMAPYNRFTPLSVQLLMKAAIEFTPYHSLKNIFRQLDELVIWGYYLKSVDESLYPNSDLVVAAMNDVAAAIRQPEKHSISKALETAFSQIYQDVFTVIARVGDTADLAVSRKEAICTVLPAHH